MSRFERYTDKTTVSYICGECGKPAASPITFECKWRFIGWNKFRGDLVEHIETRAGSITCPHCNADNDAKWPREYTETFWCNGD
jgi:DNA-directed RNA polymerase subunit RPC12/RpoP